MLAHNLVLLGAANSRKSKRLSDKTFTFLQADKENTFHVHMLEKAYASLYTNIFYDSASASALLLICS